MMVEPKHEYRKSTDGKRAFSKTTIITPRVLKEDGNHEYNEPTILYSELGLDADGNTRYITEEEFNTGIPVSKEKASAISAAYRESLKEKAVA